MKTLFLVLAMVLVVGARRAVPLHGDAGARTLAPQQPAPPRPVYDSPQLTPSEKRDVVLALDIQRELGDDVWPGFGTARIPVLVYNDVFDFLIGVARAPDPGAHPGTAADGWEPVQGDDVNGQGYLRRKSVSRTSFAVNAAGQWTGSMASRQRMNRDLPRQSGIVMEEDQYSVAVLHEMFHAYQARMSEKRFRRAEGVYRAEKRYPFADKAFIQAWTQEGAALAAAVDAATVEATVESVRRFLSVRDARRLAAALSTEALDYERELEWLEGLGKYAETRLYELAAKTDRFSAGNRFRPSRFYWADTMHLRGMLGAQAGDLRFYLSGNAQSRLLDRLVPGWKVNAMGDGVYLEDLLKKAVAGKSD